MYKITHCLKLSLIVLALVLMNKNQASSNASTRVTMFTCDFMIEVGESEELVELSLEKTENGYEFWAKEKKTTIWKWLSNSNGYLYKYGQLNEVKDTEISRLYSGFKRLDQNWNSFFWIVLPKDLTGSGKVILGDLSSGSDYLLTNCQPKN